MLVVAGADFIVMQNITSGSGGAGAEGLARHLSAALDQRHEPRGYRAGHCLLFPPGPHTTQTSGTDRLATKNEEKKKKRQRPCVVRALGHRIRGIMFRIAAATSRRASVLS
jgi:hypothetical protein